MLKEPETEKILPVVGVERAGVVAAHERVGIGKEHVHNDEVVGRAGGVMARMVGRADVAVG